MAAGDRNGVAIVGMAGRFPGAADLEAFWGNLRAGVDTLTPLDEADRRRAGVDPTLWRHPRYVRSAHHFAGADLFDAGLFGVAPRDAMLLDPQVRILLECAHAALEHAGFDPRTWPGRIGVFAGGGTDGYALRLLEQSRVSPTERLRVLEGNEKDYLPLHLSYRLDLRGPSVNVQATCATGLVAVHLACESLRAHECDLALAGAVSVELPEGAGYLHEPGSITSPDGRCRAFDAAGRGVCFSSGAGVVVLRREHDALADGDHVHAVICGSAVANDGRRKAAFMAPSEAGQYEVVAEALAVAGFGADTIGYVEAHGTGTVVGDPIEVGALTRAFRDTTERVGYCPIGSVKTNIGHTSAAAGIAGLLKTVLALERGEIPASLHFVEANPLIDFATSPFFVNTALRSWPRGPAPRRAGVSSFGLGGTNAHVVLEEAPPVTAPPAGAGLHLLAVSARSPAALAAVCAGLADVLGGPGAPALADVAHTLAVGRPALEHRRVVLCRSADEAGAGLRSVAAELRGGGLRGSGAPPASPRTDAERRLCALASEWEAGARPDLGSVCAGRRVVLPGHPLDRRRYWPDVAPGAVEAGFAIEPAPGDPPAGAGPDAPDGIFEPVWKSVPTDAPGGASRPLVVLADRGGVAEALARLAADRRLACTVLRDVAGLARDTGAVDLLDLRALDLRTLPWASADSVLDDTRRVLAGAVDLGRVVAALAHPELVRVWLVTRHAQPVAPGDPVDPGAAALWGFARSLGRELPVSSGIVDLPAASAEAAAEALLAELSAAEPRRQVALRPGGRHVPELRPAGLVEPAPRLRPDRTYVVTGGLGALGLFCAERLVELGARSLLLLGRHPPGPDAGEALGRLRAAGVAVSAGEVDVTDRAALWAALTTASHPVAGVVHAAGVSDDVTLARGATERLLAPLPAKVKGGWHLLEWARTSPVDFLVLFSSTSSLQGGVGQTGYAAAHAFIDGLAHLARDLGIPATAIAWGPWEQIGIGAARAARGGVSLALATRALRSVIATRPAQLMVGGGRADVREPGFAELLRQVGPDERLGLLRGRLRRDLGRLLGLAVEALDEQADLTALGLDSFLAIELRNRIETETGLSLPMRLVFEQTSVAALARYLAAALAAPPGSSVEALELRYSVVTSERELGRTLEALRASPDDEGASLHYLHDDADPGRFASPADLAARVARGDLVMIAVHDALGRLAGVRCATREASMPYVAGARVERLRDVHELHWLLLPEHRGRFDTDTFVRWLAAHDPLRDRPCRRVSLLTLQPAVVRGYLRALAHVVGAGPAGEERVFATLSGAARDPRALALLERVAADPALHASLAALLRERFGADLLALPGAAPDRVLEVLRPLLRPSVVHLLLTRVELMRRGEAALVGFGLRYLEPLFEYARGVVL